MCVIYLQLHSFGCNYPTNRKELFCMEQWDVVGFRKVSFKDQKTDQKIEGYTLFLQRISNDKDIDRYCNQP